MSEKLNRANRILDRACKQANLDPVEVRVAMINAIKDKQRAPVIAEATAARLGQEPENTAPNPRWANGS